MAFRFPGDTRRWRKTGQRQASWRERPAGADKPTSRRPRRARLANTILLARRLGHVRGFYRRSRVRRSNGGRLMASQCSSLSQRGQISDVKRSLQVINVRLVQLGLDLAKVVAAKLGQLATAAAAASGRTASAGTSRARRRDQLINDRRQASGCWLGAQQALSARSGLVGAASSVS